MRRAALLALPVSLALAMLPGAAAARTTKLVAYSPLDDHPQGYFARGDGIRVIARNFIPPPLCRAKVRFRFEDSAGNETTLGRFKPKFGNPQGVIARKVGEVPATAAFGRGTVKSRQSCNVGTASGRDGVLIVDPSQPRPRVTSAHAGNVDSGARTTLSFTLDRRALITAVVDFELVPGVWREVDGLLERGFYKDPGTFTMRWRAHVGGFVPAGSYRFRITPQAPAAGLGEPVAAPFTVRPRPPRPPKVGGEPATAAAARAADALALGVADFESG